MLVVRGGGGGKFFKLGGEYSGYFAILKADDDFMGVSIIMSVNKSSGLTGGATTTASCRVWLVFIGHLHKLNPKRPRLGQDFGQAG